MTPDEHRRHLARLVRFTADLVIRLARGEQPSADDIELVARTLRLVAEPVDVDGRTIAREMMRRPEPLGAYGEEMPDGEDAILAHVYEGRTLAQRWEAEHPTLGPEGVRRGLQAAMAYRESIPAGNRKRQWVWPRPFILKVDAWLMEEGSRRARAAASAAWAAKAGAHQTPTFEPVQRAETKLQTIAQDVATELGLGDAPVIGSPEWDRWITAMTGTPHAAWFREYMKRRSSA